MHMENTNTGILLKEQNPADYVLGGVTFAPKLRNVIDWSTALPEGEIQRTTASDMMDCVTFSLVHCIETQINHDIAAGKYQQESLDYFQSAGYMQDGKFRISVRYSATMNGTTPSGQYMDVAGNGARHDGLLPDADMPMGTNMTWAEYYTQPTAEQIAKAKLIYKYMDITYNWVTPGQIATALLNAPIQIAITCCPVWSIDNPIKKCTGECQHCVMVYALDTVKDYEMLDHYLPFLKKLSSDYHIFGAMQYVVEPGMAPSNFAKLETLVEEKKI